MDFIETQLPAEFIIKPTIGAYGRGVRAFTRKADGFVDTTGKLLDARQLYDDMQTDPQFDGFVVQERLRSCSELVGLTGSEALQTVRIISFIDDTGECLLLHAHFKPIVGDHIIDTYLDGMSGNTEARVDLESGLLGPANQITSTGQGIRTIPEHPTTGVAFEGFQLPMWEQTCGLVHRTTLKFLPLRTIGWDIALTPSGPLVLEGNVWWDPPNQHGGMSDIIDALTADPPHDG